MTEFRPMSSLDALPPIQYYVRISTQNGKITSLAINVPSAPGRTGKRKCKLVPPETPWHDMDVEKTLKKSNYNLERGASMEQLRAGVEEYKVHNTRVVESKKEGLERVRTLYQNLNKCCHKEIEKNDYNRRPGSAEKQEIIKLLTQSSEYTLPPDDETMTDLDMAKSAANTALGNAKKAEESYKKAYIELNATVLEKLDEIRLEVFLKEIKENIWPVTYAALPDMTFSNLVVVVLREGPLFEPSIPLLNGYLPESYKKLVWEKLIKEKSITEEMVWDDNNLNENINDTQTRIIACNKKLEVMSMKRTEH